MAPIAASCPMSAHVGEIAVRIMSVASSNSRPSSNQTPNRSQACFLAPTECLASPPGHAPQSFNGAVGNDDRGRKFYSCGDPEGETPECFCYSHWSARDQRANSEGNQR